MKARAAFSLRCEIPMQETIRHGPSRRRSPRRRSAGFTLIELLTAVTILVFGIGALISMVAATSAANQLNRETAMAIAAAQGAIERLRAAPFEEAFALYNADGDDDPDGADTAPGAGFDIRGLEAQAGDADGLPGEIVMPAAGPELWEDEDLPLFGLPRDLNMDDVVDAADHSGDYRVLPVLIRVQWQGRTGPRRIQLLTTIAEL